MSRTTCKPYSVVGGAQQALEALLQSIVGQVPSEIIDNVDNVLFTSSSPSGATLYFPCPLKEQEATAAIKALEACVVASIADLRCSHEPKPRDIDVDMDRVVGFLMSAYTTTLDGLGKSDKEIQKRIPGTPYRPKLLLVCQAVTDTQLDTDIHKAQSNIYRRLSANLYATKDHGRYYHIHGSLEASTTLMMIGLPPSMPDLTDYRECISMIESAMKHFIVSELESLNSHHRQAGVEALKWETFKRTPHGHALTSLPPFTVQCQENSTPPVPFSCHPPGHARRQILEGIKVLELCRVIAGPTIGRTLAANGALVLKVTSPHLPDVPFFQLDVNTGKHTTALDLKTARDRAIFESLLLEADVLIDGYRPGALERLGYSPAYLAAIAHHRQKGFVCVSEDCFGGTGATPPPAYNSDPPHTHGYSDGYDTSTTTTNLPNPKFEWSSRPGWQQIADCATGVAWAQGEFMGLSEPVVPPFPMSDYGTGALGATAALTGLYNRAVHGGTWVCRTSLCQYDIFLLQLGVYPEEIQRKIRQVHGVGEGPAGFFGLRHADSVDEVGKRALKSMKRAFPGLFGEGMMNSAWCAGFGGVVRWPKECVRVRGVRIGHVRGSRPNGFDEASWGGWEIDGEIAGLD